MYESWKFHLIWLDLAIDRFSLNMFSTRFPHFHFLRCRQEISFWYLNDLKVYEWEHECLSTNGHSRMGPGAENLNAQFSEIQSSGFFVSKNDSEILKNIFGLVECKEVFWLRWLVRMSSVLKGLWSFSLKRTLILWLSSIIQFWGIHQGTLIPRGESYFLLLFNLLLLFSLVWNICLSFPVLFKDLPKYSPLPDCQYPYL